MKVKPIGERILIKRLEPEAKTAGGIVLPDTAKEKPREGKVIELGDGKLLKSGGRVKANLKRVTGLFSLHTQVRRFQSTVRSICLCQRKTYWPSSINGYLMNNHNFVFLSRR